ncbi:MAG TPA: hypothetical protein VGL03_08750 [Thermoanaerobaculia bacterium]|jgi:hypothetical protein
MKRWEAWWNHVALAAVSLSGLAYGVLKYFVPSTDPDSRLPHPWQPAVMKAHVLVAPLAVFGVGLLLRRHVFRKLRHGETSGRRTGLLLLWIFAPLALSGYLVEVLVAGAAVRAAGWAHAGIGALFLIGYALHPKRKAPEALTEKQGEPGVRS